MAAVAIVAATAAEIAAPAVTAAAAEIAAPAATAAIAATAGNFRANSQNRD
jgi:hypothetical protein